MDNKGFSMSMEIYRRLAKLNPQYHANFSTPDPQCSSGINSFLNGSCMFVIANSQVCFHSQTGSQPCMNSSSQSEKLCSNEQHM